MTCFVTGLPIERFAALLTGEVDDRVLSRVAMHYHSQASWVYNAEQAKYVYNCALALPGTSTKLIAAQMCIVINGDYIPNVPHKSALVYAFEGTQPFLLKAPLNNEAAMHEASVYEELSKENHGPPHLAGPLELLDLQVCSCCYGISSLVQVVFLRCYPVYLCVPVQHTSRLSTNLSFTLQPRNCTKQCAHVSG